MASFASWRFGTVCACWCRLFNTVATSVQSAFADGCLCSVACRAVWHVVLCSAEHSLQGGAHCVVGSCLADGFKEGDCLWVHDHGCRTKSAFSLPVTCARLSLRYSWQTFPCNSCVISPRGLLIPSRFCLTSQSDRIRCKASRACLEGGIDNLCAASSRRRTGGDFMRLSCGILINHDRHVMSSKLCLG